MCLFTDVFGNGMHIRGHIREMQYSGGFYRHKIFECN